MLLVLVVWIVHLNYTTNTNLSIVLSWLFPRILLYIFHVLYTCDQRNESKLYAEKFSYYETGMLKKWNKKIYIKVKKTSS